MSAFYRYTPGCCCGADEGEEAYVAAAWGTTIVCFDAADGSVRWTFDLQSLDGSVTWTPGNLVFDPAGNLYADWVRSDERWGLLSLSLAGVFRWSLDHAATPFTVSGTLRGFGYLSHLRWRNDRLYAAPPGLASKDVLYRLDADGNLEFTLVSTNSGSVAPPLRDFDVDLADHLWLIPSGTLRFGADFLGDAQLSRLAPAGTVEWKNSQPITEASTPYSGTALIPFARAVRCSDTSADVVHVGLATDTHVQAGAGIKPDCSLAAWSRHPDYVVELGAAQTTPLVYGAGFDLCNLAAVASMTLHATQSQGVADCLDTLDGFVLGSGLAVNFTAAACGLWAMNAGSLTGTFAKTYATTPNRIGGAQSTVRWIAGTNRRVAVRTQHVSASTPPATLHVLDSVGTVLWSALPDGLVNPALDPFRRGLATFVA